MVFASYPFNAAQLVAQNSPEIVPDLLISLLNSRNIVLFLLLIGPTILRLRPQLKPIILVISMHLL